MLNFTAKSYDDYCSGKYYTSSGVSAGIDMALGFMADLYGIDVAKRIAQGIEYVWNSNKDKDDFC